MENIEYKDDWFKDFQESNDLLHDATSREEKFDIFHYQLIDFKLNDACVENDSENRCYNEGKMKLPVSLDLKIPNDQYVLNARLKELDEKVFGLNEIIKKLEKKDSNLTKQLKEVENIIEVQNEQILCFEEDLARLDQYGRRENVEFRGISENITDKILESTILEILRKIGLNHIQHYHIVACHRIGKPATNHTRSVIVRFLNRKDAIKCLQNKRYVDRCKEMGMHKISINENLCPAYRSIYEDLNKLKSKGKVTSIWTHNGTVYSKYKDNKSEKGKKITHETYLNGYFPNEF